jgi:DUF971 family protein
MRNLARGQTLDITRLQPAWLRDNCPCPLCRDRASGQRLIAITDQAEPVTITAAIEAADGLHVTFAPDGHKAVFSWSWLADQTVPAIDARSEEGKRLWTASDFPAGPQPAARARYLGDDAVRLDCLRHLLSDGFMLLHGVPARDPADDRAHRRRPDQGGPVQQPLDAADAPAPRRARRPGAGRAPAPPGG